MVVCLIFERMLRLWFSFLYACLLYGFYYLKCFFFGIYLVTNGTPLTLCFIFVM